MRQAVGTTQIINYIIIFIVITFGFLIATLSYMKAFKVNSKISGIIEKYEGYNDLSKKESQRTLNAIGYRKNGGKCPAKYSNIEGYRVCLQETQRDSNKYFKYKIITYLDVDIPIVGSTFSIPIKSETEKIYYFSE